jgi:prophage maintenance system killer protein
MEVLLLLNGSELRASAKESETIMLELAAGRCTRERLVEWIRQHMIAC